MTLRSDVLAYIPSPAQGVWNLGPFPLRAYALCIILGIIVAIWWGERRWQARGGREGTVLDVAMFAVPFGLIGGRLYHVATDWEKYFGQGARPIEALYIWQGGLGIWGAVFLGGIGAWLACRIYRIPLPAFGDAIAPPVLLAQAIGRLGNWFNQELYGRETTVPWGLEIYPRFDANGDPDAMAGVSNGVVEKIVHPTFLYELLWNVLVVVLLVQIDKRYRIGHGRLFALYVAGYSFGRFFVELMRDDEATEIFGIRINNFTSALVFLAALAYVVFATKGREHPSRLQPGATTRPWPWQWKALRAAGPEANTPAPAEPETVTFDGADGESVAAKADSEPAKGAAAKGAAAKGAAEKGDAKDSGPEDADPERGTGAAAAGETDSATADAESAGVEQTGSKKAAADEPGTAERQAETAAGEPTAADTTAVAEDGESPASGAAEKPAAAEESAQAAEPADNPKADEAASAGKSGKPSAGSAG
ncbi:prolipoprotein diacylglyceryl transferase [Nocardia higoensis]|uniref:prolipoprotein diacylglyceryl transferase n=1 Tax=Nocardia higoensis TaxID=228599 RepID=UPI0002D2FD78|nr:prolipoprotein diacylglyceryl transferase [Nocardia higoensis]